MFFKMVTPYFFLFFLGFVSLHAGSIQLPSAQEIKAHPPKIIPPAPNFSPYWTEKVMSKAGQKLFLMGIVNFIVFSEIDFVKTLSIDSEIVQRTTNFLLKKFRMQLADFLLIHATDDERQQCKGILQQAFSA